MTPASDADRPLTEGLLRAFALLAYVFAVSGLARAWWADTGRLTLLLLLVIEGYTLLLVLLARPARMRDLAPATVAATVYAAFFYVLLEPRGTVRLVPEAAGVALQVAGMLLQFSAKFVLGRSFGLLPAQRGLVLGGPYRWVRHPMYLGYLVSHAGFLLANASGRNALVLAVLYAAQAIRIAREEAVLAGTNEDYRAYQRRVRWRLIPYVY